MKVSEVLTEAKALIVDPANWMQGDYTEVREGRTCFCSLGAIATVMMSYPESGVTWFGESTATPAARALRSVVGSSVQMHETFAPYNDSHTHSEVMEAFDKAIALALTHEVQG